MISLPYSYSIRYGEPFVGYSDVFSFNNPAGMCEYCEGLSKIEIIDIERLLDKNISLNEGAIRFPTFEPGGWRLTRYIHSGFFDNDKTIKDYSAEELELLLYADGIKVKNPTPEWHKTSLYEGLLPRIERSFLKKEDGEKVRYGKEIERFVVKQDCPHCHGTRLNDKVLSCKVNGKNIAECADMQINELLDFVQSIHAPVATTIVSELVNRIQHMISIGLGYLNLGRETSTLSGGESQRIKMVSQLGSSLTDLTYIFDEPSIGLHPHDISKINELMRLLRDKGNTVLIVEHDPDMIKIADHIIDMGPGAGTHIIRKLFAKRNGVSASLFSFNSQGAFSACKGLGVTYTDLAFMDTIVTVCEECHGNRYTDEVLAYQLIGKSIADVLKMTVTEALEYFQEKEIVTVLKRLSDVGITYVSLGQPLSALSGGELQRIKLASELKNGGQIYVLDEPSTGLHMADIKQLISVMNRLVEQNSTLIVIEHNLDIICQADWIIDIGPYAGQNGGKIMFTGVPKDLINCPDSLTGKHLKKYINEK